MRNDEESPIVDKAQYQRLVGKLIYLAHTILDISYAVSVVSQSILGRGLIFRRSGRLSMDVYTEANYAGLVTDRSRRST